jgi:hypothetical protein
VYARYSMLYKITITNNENTRYITGDTEYEIVIISVLICPSYFAPLITLKLSSAVSLGNPVFSDIARTTA